MTLVLRLWLIILMMSVLSACVAIRAFPHSVRAGDTITLAIGSLDGANKNNITVLYYPDTDPLNPIELTNGIRSVLRLYPDKTSESYWDTTSGGSVNTLTYVNVLSAHGPWLTVVVLDLPANLTPGTGSIKVTPGQDVKYPNFMKKVTDVNIGLEILPVSTGASHVFEYAEADFNNETLIGDVAKLDPLKQVVVRSLPSTSAPFESISAAEYQINISAIDQGGNSVIDLLTENDLAVVLDDQPKYVKNQTNLNWSKSGNIIKVNITSMKGNQNPLRLRFSILLSNLELAATNGYSLDGAPFLLSVKYYNANGDEIVGPVPQVIIQN